MSTTTATRTVTATCACGASFEREVKRGRPQVWCPACVAIPFYDRNRAQAATTTTEAGVEIENKPVNEHDALGHVREQLESDVAAFYEAKGWADSNEQMKGLQAIYAKYRNN